MTDACVIRMARGTLDGPPENHSIPAPCAPLLKWVGGKTGLLPELVKRMPKTFGRYYEPFAGGAALFFHLARPGSVLSDLNVDLMATYQAVANSPELVSLHLARKARFHTSPGYDEMGGFYYYQRDWWNRIRHVWSVEMRAATMLYLNRTCYNGLWRTNKKGEMNAPQGRYVNPTICDPQRIAACSTVLSQATLIAGDYQETTKDIRPGDFVYFDPPYVPASPTASFSSYNADDFGERQQRELAAYAKALVAKGVQVMLSNSDTKLVRSLYRDRSTWRLHRVKARRSVNSSADKRGPVGELIITGGYDAFRRRA